MPTEVRRITFKPSELAEALGAQSKAPDIEVSEAVLSFVVGPEGEQQLELTPRGSAKGSGGPLRMDAREVGAALVRYCLDRGVPIPKQASRSLALNVGNVALFIHMNEEAESTNVALPDFYDYDFYG